MTMSNKLFSKYQEIGLFSAAVIFCAQFSFNLFNSDFKISIGILVFSISVVLFGKVPLLPVTLISAVGVLCSRIIVPWLRTGTLSISSHMPEIFFYLTYGLLLYIYCERKNYQLPLSSVIPLFFFDCISNLVELLVRSYLTNYALDTLFSIIIIAFFRTLLIWFLFCCLKYYKFSLLKREHIERYQRLLLLISRLNDEVVLMKKNTQMIEETMNTSYRLFHDMEDSDIDPALSRKALSVAKDVHELKKEYMLILRGLSDAMELNLQDEGMYLSDILQLLKNSQQNALPSGKNLTMDIQIHSNLYTQKHYFLMSILRNLFNNAVEASKKSSICIQFEQKETDDNYILIVEDDGPGILPEDLAQIFHPGFSTKINYDTGEVNRGLGLNLVQDLVEHQFHGTIEVTSIPGKTTFTICIPKDSWKGDPHENLSD